MSSILLEYEAFCNNFSNHYKHTDPLFAVAFFVTFLMRRIKNACMYVPNLQQGRNCQIHGKS